MQSPPPAILKSKYIAINATALFKQNKTGVEWYVWQLLKYLKREWKESDPPIILFTPDNLGKIPYIQSKNWFVKVLPGNLLWTQHHLLKFLKRYPPALLFSPSYTAPRFLPINIPTVNVVHGLEGEHFPEFRSLEQILSDYLLTIPTLKKSSTIIAVSEHSRKDLNHFYNIPFNKIETVLSGPGTLDDNFTPNFDKLTARSVKFLFLGGSSERKNLKLAIRIFLKIKRQMLSSHPDAILEIAGEIKNNTCLTSRQEIFNFIESRKKDIISLGYISEKEKNEQLKSANFLFYPSFYEGFGFPVLEAQANGAIPIVLKNSGLDEVGGKGMIEIDIQKEKESIAKITDCIKNPDNYRIIQKLGLENVQRYNWQKCAQEVRKILLEI